MLVQDYLDRLSSDGLFDKYKLADQIALLAIYIPIIRREVFKFIKLWNVHRIRRQPKRPNCIYGQPVQLYHWPAEGTRDYGLRPNQEIITALTEDLSDWGISFPL